MSATSFAKPVVKEPLHLVPRPEPKTTLQARIQARAETNPLIIVFVACIVAFHLAAAMVGSVAAWVYYLRK